MMEWKEENLENILKFYNGKAIKDMDNGNYPVYGSNGIIGYSNGFKYENALIIGRVGAYCGSLRYEKKKFWATDNTIVATTKDGYYQQFMFYVLHSFPLNDLAGGSAQPLLNQTILSRIKLKIPPLPIQRKIAAVLSAYDDLIDNNTRRIAILERMAEEIYREWFVRMRFPGHERVKFQKGVPEGWEVVSLGELANITMGQSPSSEFYNQTGEGLPFNQGVGTYGQRFPTREIFCSVSGRIAKKGDILFSVRAPVGRLNIADCKMIIGRGLSAISHREHYNSYLFYALKTAFSDEDIIGNGAIFNAVSKKELLNFKMNQPAYNLDGIFDKLIAPMDRRVELLTHFTQ
ncbi:restriction modification system DNA specificity domain protein [Candidatus Vecturithrix granuli]|uniref:Restriction modification system DNA specificity domain protein n=1 Tax=Vecturithrix granuli TaxID=1499967 RepID=A0A081BUS9_VECG1|nr:restriction modification system DNA specificity domain protein [Candidatus Vecturithrix granuli]